MKKRSLFFTCIVVATATCPLVFGREPISRPKPPSNIPKPPISLIRSLNTQTVKSLNFNSSASKLITARDKMDIWNVSTGERESRINSARYPNVDQSAVSSKGTLAATINYDDEFVSSMLLLWNMQTGKVVRSIRNVAPNGIDWNDIKFSPDGNSIAVARGASDGTYSSISLWDVQTGKLSKTVARNTANEIQFSPNGNTIAVAGKNTIHLWDVSSGRLKLSFSHPVVESLAFSSDGAVLASISADKSSFGGTIRIWDAKNGKILHTLRPKWFKPSSIVFVPNSKTLIVGGGSLPNKDGGKVINEGESVILFYNSTRGTSNSHLIVPKRGVINKMAISPNGNILATNEYGSESGNTAVKLWRLK